MFFAFAGLASNQFHGYLFENKGCDALDVGLLLMTGYAAAIAAPLAQVLIIRHCDGPYWPLRAVCLGAALSLALLPHALGFWSLSALFLLLSFCFASINPLLTAATLETTRHRGHGLFVRIRGLGTAGFLVSCLICLAFPRSSALPWMYAGFGFALLLSLAALNPASRRKDHAPASARRIRIPLPAPDLRRAWSRLSRGETSVLLLLLAAMNFANVMATAIQGNYLIHRFGLDQRSISLAWVVSTSCEIGWMILCAKAIKAMDIRRVMVLGLWGTLIKLVLLAWANNYATFILGLAFHGFFFSFTLAGFGVYLDKRFRQSERPAMQALTAAVTQGLPAALAGLTGGLLWHYLDLRAVFIVSALLAALTCISAEVWTKQRRVYFRSWGDSRHEKSLFARPKSHALQAHAGLDDLVLGRLFGAAGPRCGQGRRRRAQ